jgi:hypothetical protein
VTRSVTARCPDPGPAAAGGGARERRSEPAKMASISDGLSRSVKKKKPFDRPSEADPENEAAVSEVYGPHLPPPPSNPIDEIPIIKSGPSSWEELLERELAKEQAMKQNAGGTAAGFGGSAQKTNFLKRGNSREMSGLLGCVPVVGDFINLLYSRDQ